ncbi:MAG: murein hydrolase activator EnvC family protein [Kiloniellaceae bacterium]
MRTPPAIFCAPRAGRAAAAVLWPAATLPTAAQQERLEAVERRLEADRTKAEELGRKGAALELEIEALRTDSIAAARQAQNLEAELSAIEARLAELGRKETEMVAALQARRRQLGVTLAALQRIALQPVDSLIASPGSPIDMVRSAMLLRVAVPAIKRRAEVLRGELLALDTLRGRIALQRNESTETARALDAERERLAALIRRKTAIRAATAAEQEAARARAARLTEQAKDLRELIERIERAARERAEREARERAEREAARRAAGAPEAESKDQGPAPSAGRWAALAKPANIRPFPSSRASLIMPARGRVVTRYGQELGDDSVAKGITIAARSGAQVVAPYDGQVVYAGSFRRYGQILIIEHGGRYHTLLAGLDRIDAVPGQWLLAGEPVGILGAPRDGHPELYLELRRTGQPINPLPWLATTGDKVRG